jgi:DNA-binding transcriptional MerR regulator
MEIEDDEKRWSVGELARASGLTVRTLHHWDEIGLLVPGDRSHAGRRRYGPADVARLYRVVALRRLGLSLHDIGGVLDGAEGDLRTVVARQLEQVEAELEHRRALRDRLSSLLSTLDRDGAEPPTSADLMTTIEVMTMHEQYYSEEQLSQLDERRRELGDEGMERVQREWAEVIAAMTAERDAGTDPADPRVQEIAGRWSGLLEQFTGGDPEIAGSLKRMYAEQGVERASHGMVDPELMEYVGRALAARGA